MHADADKQGLVQGMITGMRGLCNGLGPAMFGVIFTLFNVDLTEKETPYSRDTLVNPIPANVSTAGDENNAYYGSLVTQVVPGPPFVFGALLVILALMVSAFIPDALAGMGTSLGSDFYLASMAERQHPAGGGQRGHRHRDSDGSGSAFVAIGGGDRRRSNNASMKSYRKRPLAQEAEDDDEDDGSDREYTVPLIHTQTSGSPVAL